MIAEELQVRDPTQGTLVADLKARADQLDKSVQIRKKVIAAFVTYAERLASIAESAVNEQKKVDETVQAVQGLADSVGTLAPIPAVASSADVVKEIATLIGDGVKAVEQMRASKTLAEAMSKAGVAVSRFTAAVTLDMADLEGVFRLEPVQVAGLMQQVYVDQLGSVPKKIRAQREQAVKALNDAAVVDGKAIDAVYEQDQLAVKARGLMGGPEIDAASARADAGLASIAVVRVALREWADAHDNVALAIREGWQPNLSALADSVAELTKHVAELHKDEEAIKKIQSEQKRR
jgi:hypothetical protein